MKKIIYQLFFMILSIVFIDTNLYSAASYSSKKGGIQNSIITGIDGGLDFGYLGGFEVNYYFGLETQFAKRISMVNTIHLGGISWDIENPYDPPKNFTFAYNIAVRNYVWAHSFFEIEGGFVKFDAGHVMNTQGSFGISMGITSSLNKNISFEYKMISVKYLFGGLKDLSRIFSFTGSFGISIKVS